MCFYEGGAGCAFDRYDNLVLMRQEVATLRRMFAQTGDQAQKLSVSTALEGGLFPAITGV